jgi:hypothetical protein
MTCSLTTRAINRAMSMAIATLFGCGGGDDTTAPPPPPPPAGSLIISLGATSLSVAIGSTGTMTAAVTRVGTFTDAITVNVTGLPSGVTVSSNTQTTVGPITNATLTFTVVSSATTGTSTVTISASGAGVTTVTATFTLTLTAVVNNSSLNFAQCGAGAKPVFVAFQNGVAGTWTPVTGVNDVYSFNITQDKGGYAYVWPTQGGTAHQTTVFLGTRNQVGGSLNVCGSTVPPQRTITGTVTGMAPGQASNVYMGGRPGFASPATPNFTISSVPDGPRDLVLFRSAGTASAQDRGIIRQNQTLAHNTNVGTLDMNGPESFGLATATVTIGGAQNGGINLTTIVFLSGASCDAAAVTGLSGPSTSFLIIGVPDARMRATDMHQVSVFAGSTEGTRGTTEVFHTLSNRTIDLPPIIMPTVSSAAGAAYKRMSATFALPTEYNQLVGMNLSSTGTVRNTVAITATTGWTGTAVSLVTPNFTGLAGWNDSWGPAASAPANWAFNISGSTAGASLCAAGTKQIIFNRAGQL